MVCSWGGVLVDMFGGEVLELRPHQNNYLFIIRSFLKNWGGREDFNFIFYSYPH